MELIIQCHVEEVNDPLCVCVSDNHVPAHGFDVPVGGAEDGAGGLSSKHSA